MAFGGRDVEEGAPEKWGEVEVGEEEGEVVGKKGREEEGREESQLTESVRERHIGEEDAEGDRRVEKMGEGGERGLTAREAVRVTDKLKEEGEEEGLEEGKKGEEEESGEEDLVGVQE